MQWLNFCQAVQLAICSHTAIVVKHCPLFQTNFFPSGYGGRILRLVEERNRFPIHTSSARKSFTIFCFGTLPKLHVLWNKFIQNNGTYLPKYTASLFIRPSSSYTYFRTLHSTGVVCSRLVERGYQMLCLCSGSSWRWACKGLKHVEDNVTYMLLLNCALKLVDEIILIPCRCCWY